MNDKKLLLSSIITFALFILFTISLLFVDRQYAGESNTLLGYATINVSFNQMTGIHKILYTLSDIGSMPAIGFGMFLGVIGLIQWIKRKNILKVDYELLVLGLFYITVFILFAIFQMFVINYRPILIDGQKEASYPSSTTFLSITFMTSAFPIIDKYLHNKKTIFTLKVVAILYMLLLIVLRIFSGAHWFTDILGSILISIACVLLYFYFIKLFKKTAKD